MSLSGTFEEVVGTEPAVTVDLERVLWWLQAYSLDASELFFPLGKQVKLYVEYLFYEQNKWIYSMFVPNS